METGSNMKFLRSVLFALVPLLLLVACGQSPTAHTAFGEVASKPEQHTEARGHASQPPSQDGSLQPVIATSELVVSPNRMALGLLENNMPIKDAAETTVKLRYYKLNGEQGTLVGEEDARYFGENLGPRGMFIAYPNFDTAGR
jgi:hypothetical protein